MLARERYSLWTSGLSAADDGTAVHAGFLSMRVGADTLQAGDERTSGLDEPAWSGVRYVPRVPRRLMVQLHEPRALHLPHHD